MDPPLPAWSRPPVWPTPTSITPPSLPSSSASQLATRRATGPPLRSGGSKVRTAQNLQQEDEEEVHEDDDEGLMSAFVPPLEKEAAKASVKRPGASPDL